MRRFRIISAFLAVVFVLGITGCEALRKQPSDGDDYWFNFGGNKNRGDSTVTICDIPLPADIKSLSLYDKNVSDEDMAKIGRLTDLTSLTLIECQIRDITPLKNLTDLTYLVLHNNQIKDITSLKKLTKLTWLDLNDNQISDITPLANLTNLETLLLYDNQISDEDLTYLRTRLHGCDILCDLDFATIQGGQFSVIDTTNLTLYSEIVSDEDMAEIGKLVNLTSLSLRRCQIRDITPLKNLTNLTSLDLEGNKISDVTPLADLTNLETLILYDNQISDEDLAYLRTRLHGCDILCDLDFATIQGGQFSVIDTTYLTFSNQPVSDEDMAEIGKLVNLTSLSLSRCQIRDITPLKNLTKLTWLALDGNQISDVTPLADLTNLETLMVFDNQVSDEDLTYLKTRLHGCDILCDLDFATIQGGQFSVIDTTNLTLYSETVSDEDMAEIGKLVNLTSLSLRRCQIRDITPLKNLTKLTWLALDGNQISDVTPLANLTNLETLMVFDNQVSDEQLEWLKQALPNCEIYG